MDLTTMLSGILKSKGLTEARESSADIFHEFKIQFPLAGNQTQVFLVTCRQPVMQHPIIGIWNGCAFPTQETTVIFFEDGNGLLFFYWGSQGEPTLSEFKWLPNSGNSVQLEWIVRHDYDYNSPGEEDDDDEAAIEDQRDHTKAHYTIIDRSLVIHIGMHEFDHALNFVGAPGNFATRKPLWEKYTKEFNPFGPGRQVWIASGHGWQKTGFTIDEKKPWWKFW